MANWACPGIQNDLTINGHESKPEAKKLSFASFLRCNISPLLCKVISIFRYA